MEYYSTLNSQDVEETIADTQYLLNEYTGVQLKNNCLEGIKHLIAASQTHKGKI